MRCSQPEPSPLWTGADTLAATVTGLEPVWTADLSCSPVWRAGGWLEWNAQAGMARPATQGILPVVFHCPPAAFYAINQPADRMERGNKLTRLAAGNETWMRAREAAAKGISDAFLQGSGYPDLVWSLLIVAVLPSLGEELLFRGTLQPLFSRWTGSKHAGVWLSAILFSAIHMQFFGFVPRLLLGVIFGYALLRSGSLWLPVLLHFWNNGTIVVVTWLNARGLIHLDEAELSVFHPLWAIILGGALGLWLLFFMKETAHKPLESSSKLDIS